MLVGYPHWTAISGEQNGRKMEMELRNRNSGNLEENEEANGSQTARTELKRRKSEQIKETREIVREFLETTSAHGWAHIVRGHSGSMKTIWFVLTLLALVVTVVHVIMLVHQYLKFPYEQVIEIEYAIIDFPSVTICNLQPVSLSSAEVLVKDTSTRFHRWTNIIQGFDKELAKQTTQINGTFEASRFKEKWKERMRNPLGYFENIGKSEVKRIGHHGQDFILGCEYSDKSCGPENFTYFANPSYFNCFTFNGGSSKGREPRVRSTGPEAGLSLVLYLEADNGDFQEDGIYFTSLSSANSAGVRVNIHPPDTRPNPADGGFDVPPGYSSSVGFRVYKNNRLGEPYVNCASSKLPAGGELDVAYAYSVQHCMQICEPQYIATNCGCVSAYLPHPEGKSSLKFCGFFNETDPKQVFKNSKCEVNHSKLFARKDNLRRACRCYPPCLEYRYKTEVSYSYWPNDFSQKDFFNKYVTLKNESATKSYENLGKMNITRILKNGLIRKNFVRLNVYGNTRVITESIEKGSYTFFSLFSDIGGTCGLWIGMSILTWGEVFELIGRLFLRWIKKLCRTRNVGDSSRPNPPRDLQASA